MGVICQVWQYVEKYVTRKEIWNEMKWHEIAGV